MSTVSENISERRGRPPRFDPDFVALIRGLYPEATTERGVLNYCYLVRAVGALGAGQEQVPFEFEWLFTERRMRRVVLYALGRQDWDDESIRQVAKRICQDGMCTKAAVDFIRLVEALRNADEDGRPSKQAP